jgi:hypothetical protein
MTGGIEPTTVLERRADSVSLLYVVQGLQELSPRKNVTRIPEQRHNL